MQVAQLCDTQEEEEVNCFESDVQPRELFHFPSGYVRHAVRQLDGALPGFLTSRARCLTVPGSRRGRRLRRHPNDQAAVQGEMVCTLTFRVIVNLSEFAKGPRLTSQETFSLYYEPDPSVEQGVRSMMAIMMALPVHGTVAPILRGYLHLAGAIVAPFALLLLLFIADSPRGVVGGAIFGASLIILYSTSAAYHLLPLGRRSRGVMKRLDHSNIFVFIAGAYTPFALKLMSNSWGIPVLSVVGGLALVGFITALAAPAPPRWVRVGLYLAIGWVGIAAISQLLKALPGEAFAMLVLSGILFSLGGAAYAARWPDPFPRVFGYHEVFHALQVAATAVIYSVVAIYVLQS